MIYIIHNKKIKKMKKKEVNIVKLSIENVQ